ncbi:MAG: GIY-YIG nuclease family protein, partial [Candidatus Sungbacteria bacterium]|nr:GIY-YIG nuclease family protein [Candidatus Sungbacteria bacterium]
MFYVYVLRSRSSERLYTGYTADLRKRFSRHTSNTG